MAKNKTVFVCSGCGYESPKWMGKCPACNEWNSFYEEKIVSSSSKNLGTKKGFNHVGATVLKALNIETNIDSLNKTNSLI